MTRWGTGRWGDSSWNPKKTYGAFRRKLEPMIAEEIVDRAAARENRFWRAWNFVWWCFPVVTVILVGITEPVHSWLRAHLQFLWGVLVGSLLQVPGWLRDRWRWMRWFSWQ